MYTNITYTDTLVEKSARSVFDIFSLSSSVAITGAIGAYNFFSLVCRKILTPITPVADL